MKHESFEPCIDDTCTQARPPCIAVVLRDTAVLKASIHSIAALLLWSVGYCSDGMLVIKLAVSCCLYKGLLKMPITCYEECYWTVHPPRDCQWWKATHQRCPGPDQHWSGASGMNWKRYLNFRLAWIQANGSKDWFGRGWSQVSWPAVATGRPMV